MSENIHDSHKTWIGICSDDNESEATWSVTVAIRSLAFMHGALEKASKQRKEKSRTNFFTDRGGVGGGDRIGKAIRMIWFREEQSSA